MSISGMGFYRPMNFTMNQRAANDGNTREIVGVDPEGRPMYITRDKDGNIIEYPKEPGKSK